MIRMRNRNMAPVNGWQFFQAETGWDLVRAVPTAQWDFNLAVDSIIAHRKLNPRFNLPTDRNTVAESLDMTNALRMKSVNGGETYIMSDESPPPPTLPQHPSGLLGVAASLRNVAAGASSIVEWIKSGEEAVPQALANQRAYICSNCPCNDKGDWTRFFTVPAQAAIRKALQERREWNLKTPHDEQLVMCVACKCPLPLKVHMPIERITKRLSDEAFNALDTRCWIRIERTA